MEHTTFKVMVTFPHLLKEKIVEFNKLHGTEFELVEIIYDEVPFCLIKGIEVTCNQIFNLGYSLAVKQYKLREQGKLEW